LWASIKKDARSWALGISCCAISVMYPLLIFTKKIGRHCWNEIKAPSCHHFWHHSSWSDVVAVQACVYSLWVLRCSQSYTWLSRSCQRSWLQHSGRCLFLLYMYWWSQDLPALLKRSAPTRTSWASFSLAYLTSQPHSW
jgi:hypothetical protein